MNEFQRYEDYSQQADESGKGSNAGRAVTFFLIGMGVGAAAALLFTPMSGSELRQTIGDGCRRAVDGISEQTRNLRERGSSLLRFRRHKQVG